MKTQHCPSFQYHPGHSWEYLGGEKDEHIIMEAYCPGLATRGEKTWEALGTVFGGATGKFDGTGDLLSTVNRLVRVYHDQRKQLRTRDKKITKLVRENRALRQELGLEPYPHRGKEGSYEYGIEYKANDGWCLYNHGAAWTKNDALEGAEALNHRPEGETPTAVFRAVRRSAVWEPFS